MAPLGASRPGCRTRGRASDERKGIIYRWTLLLVAAIIFLSLLPQPGSSADSQRRSSVARLRHGIEWQRSATYRWQDYAGVPRTPTDHAERHTRSAAYLHWMLGFWNRHRRHAKHYAAMLDRGSVQSVICRVFRPIETCSTALYIAKRESGYDIHAWNSSDHGGLFQLGTVERAEYATIGYATAYQQTVAAHNLYLARGWQPWSM